jgi:hypothetical protein
VTAAAVQLRNETKLSVTCAATGCNQTIPRRGTGRPAQFCSTACRVRDHRRRHADDAISVEVDMGSATSRGRPPERAWLVRIRRGDSYVIVNTGLRRLTADRLAEQLTDLLTNKSPQVP